MTMTQTKDVTMRHPIPAGDSSSPCWPRAALTLAAVLAALVMATPAQARPAAGDEDGRAKNSVKEEFSDASAGFDRARRQQTPPPSSLIQLSAAAGGGARLAGTDLFRGDKSVDQAVPLFEVVGEVRVLSFAGLRGGVVMEQGEGPTATSVRGGFALHFMSSKVHPDLYLLTDLNWNASGPDDAAGTRGVAVGMGFRVRMGRHVVLGVEGAFEHDGIQGGDDSPFPHALQRILLGDTIDPTVSAHLGFVL
jgi:hypothetical protein